MTFDSAKCDMTECHGECLTRCPYTDYSEEEAKEEMKRVIKGESADILEDCITCYSCNEFCPLGANPWDLISWRQQQTGILGIPEDVKPASDWITKPTKIEEGEPGGPLISFGGLDETIPMWDIFTGSMFEEATLVRGGEYACGHTETHLGRALYPLEYLPEWVEKLSDLADEYDVEEIVFTHDACYNNATTFAMEQNIEVPFKPVHILEYLRNWLQENEDKIEKELDMDIAYQGGCTTRFAPEWKEEIWRDWLVDIFDLIGVSSVDWKREYTGEDRLCCGAGIFHTQHDRAIEIQQRNIQDAIDAGAEAYVFHCPACTAILRKTSNEMGLDPYYMVQLIKLALGEELGDVGGAALGKPVK